MKEYNLKDFSNLKEFQTQVLVNMSEDFVDVAVSSNTYTDCEIVELINITEFNSRPDILAEVSVKGGFKQFCMRGAINSGLITLPTNKKELFDSYIKQLDEAKNYFDVKLAEVMRLREVESEKERKLFEAKVAKAKELKEAKALEEKFLKKAKADEEKLITDYNNCSLKALTQEQINDFCEENNCSVGNTVDTIDWLTEHTKSIRATIPSHLEAAFRRLIPTGPIKVVDSKRKTSGGYSMKFGPSLVLTFDKDVEIPVELAARNIIKKNTITNTRYIFHLIRDCGFVLGGNPNYKADNR